MQSKTILKIGIFGTIFAAICCFTPFLVIVLGAVGLSAWLGWLDFILLPGLAVFVLIMIYGFIRHRKDAGDVSERTT